MKAVLIVAGSLTMFFGAAGVASAHVYTGAATYESASDKGPEVYRAGFMEPSLRDSVLAKAWSYETGQYERGGCMPRGSWRAYPTAASADGKALDSGYYVYRIDFQNSATAHPTSIQLNCGKGVPFFHTHPYQSCDDSGNSATCKSGGWYASFCEPSKADLRLMYEMRAPFGVIQCDRFAFRFFFLADIIRT
jgi:hypothetical protein